MKSLKQKIDEIITADFEIHYIFKEIVKNKSIFTKDEEIVDLMFMKREYLNESKNSSQVYSAAKLLVATTHGLVYAEEGFVEINDDYMGYKIKHIDYDKISSLELDLSLLKGEFSVVTGSSVSTELYLEFNKASYFKEFENFVNIIRKEKLGYEN